MNHVVIPYKFKNFLRYRFSVSNLETNDADDRVPAIANRRTLGGQQV